MKKLILSMALCLAASQGFSQGVTITDSILSSGMYRKFRLYKPNIYNGNTARPLVLNLHGYTSNATQQQSYTKFTAVADTANFLVVHPEGTYTVGGQFWNAGYGPGVNDLQFMIDLVDSLSMIYNIDPQRVYSCGMSNGGIMSYYLACNAWNKFAAVASVTGSMLNSWFGCAPPRPFPVMEIHGTADGTVPYNGNGSFANIDSVMKKWRVHNACNPSPVTYSVPDVNMTDNSTAVNYKWLNGNNGSSVELYKVINGSHSWPGAFPFVANTNQDFSATVEIWRFFRQYTLNQLISGVPEHAAQHTSLFHPNPAKDMIFFKEESDVEIWSLDGKLLLAEKSTKQLKLELQGGLYLVKIKHGGKQQVQKLLID